MTFAGGKLESKYYERNPYQVNLFFEFQNLQNKEFGSMQNPKMPPLELELKKSG